ncbi:MAG: hypothetical protein HY005_00710 [Candidatus Staskawiczbacteria bacterium]|nr:hypothetical protein [Candidatus Staskawiczbacteria bacterium]MBI3337129.1 hypothetical protein [Candidatus Staskawiczbacteria bacterium]
MNIQHKELANGRWFRFSLSEQMANIGSEIGRAINWRVKDVNDSKMALERGLELLDLTIDDPKNIKRLKELLRVREMIVDYFYFDNIYGSTDEKWNNYFYSFNYAAMLNKNV